MRGGMVLGMGGEVPRAAAGGFGGLMLVAPPGAQPEGRKVAATLATASAAFACYRLRGAT